MTETGARARGEGETGAHPGARYLVTGALGCIGAWTVVNLVRDGMAVVAFDLGAEPRRIRQLATSQELAAITFVRGDITDLASIERVLDDHAITHVIHLAALQVPFCRADPPLGAVVNVVGTVNVFEAVRRRSDRIGSVVYAGSIGMFGPLDGDPGTGRLEPATDAHPTNHYGVYKLANEGTARVYWADNGLPSIGLRPLTVFGLGRDQGLTSGPTKAILAAILGRPYRIGFGGTTLFNYADDVAKTLILATRTEARGPLTINLPGSRATVREFVAAIEAAVPGSAGLIAVAEEALPFPDEISTAGIEALGSVPITPLDRAVASTARLFDAQLRAGTLVPEQHGLEPGAG